MSFYGVVDTCCKMSTKFIAFKLTSFSKTLKFILFKYEVWSENCTKRDPPVILTVVS